MDSGAGLLGHGQAFAFFYVLGFAAGYAVEFWEGRRRGFPLVPWTALMALVAAWGVVGSQIGTIPFSSWREALAQGAIPSAVSKTFVFGLPAAVIAILVGERWLGFRRTTLDAFAIALPAGLAIGRIGCLLSGCCFGTPSNLPWAIAYPAGTHAFDLHVLRGLVLPGAASALPVHPVQLYEILLLVPVIAVLAYARGRLHRAGSLFLLYVALQSAARFAVELVREGPATGLVLGLRPLQWVLPVIAIASASAVWLRERSPDGRPRSAPAHSLFRSASVVTLLVAFLAVFNGWFTPLERCVVAVVALPAALLVGFEVLRASAQGRTRWAAAATLGISLALLGLGGDEPPPVKHVGYYVVGGGAGAGSYEVVEKDCNGNVINRTYYPYNGVCLDLARSDRWSDGWGTDIELRGFRDNGSNGPLERQNTWGGTFLAGFDARVLALKLGAVGWVDTLNGDVSLIPAGRLRAGVLHRPHLELGLFDRFPAHPGGSAALVFPVGQSVQLGLGVSEKGVFVNPEFAGPGFDVSPIVAFGGSGTFHAGIALKFCFGTQPFRAVDPFRPFAAGPR